MEEIWKDIEGYEGLYQVSNMGNVKSLGRYRKTKHNGVAWLKEKIMKPKIGKNGYYEISLMKNGKHKSHIIHRLVAKAFIPNPENKPCIDHINTNRFDNRIENLRWCTQKENLNNPISVEKQQNDPKKSKPILVIKKGEIVMFFPSASEAGRKGFTLSSVTECARGEKKHHKGYQWQYVEDYLAEWWDKEMDKYMEMEKTA